MTTPTALKETTVDDVMTTSLMTVAADESVLLAYELASRAQVHHVPVMSEGKCIGVIDTKTLRSWSLLPLETARPTVSELLDDAQLTIASGRPLSEAARVMHDNNADAVLIVDSAGLLRGIVTWRDIVRLVAGVERPTQGPSHTHPVLFTIEPVIQAPSHVADVS